MGHEGVSNSFIIWDTDVTRHLLFFSVPVYASSFPRSTRSDVLNSTIFLCNLFGFKKIHINGPLSIYVVHPSSLYFMEFGYVFGNLDFVSGVSVGFTVTPTLTL